MWLKVKNPNAPAVKREAEEDWGVNPEGSVAHLESAEAVTGLRLVLQLAPCLPQ